MKLFVDSADPAEIGACVAEHRAAGVTTNAVKLLEAARGTHRSMHQLLGDICGAAKGPVSVELGNEPSDRERALGEARLWAQVSANVVVMLPAGDAGLEIVRACAAEGIRTGTSAGRSPEQALAAARAGAAYLSTPVGRTGGFDGDDLIRKLVALLRTYDMKAEIVAVGIRSPSDVIDAALAGAHAAAAPAAVLRALPAESVRDQGGR